MENYHINPDKIIELVIAYLPRLALAIITLIVGLWLIRIFVNGIQRLMKSKKVDESLQSFLKSVVSIVLKILLLISVMGMIGIEMTSFIAVLGAVGLSFGMALSGALQHFAGGVLILIYNPFKKGDFIESLGQKGIVKEIRIFNTVINSVDNKVIYIPNGPLSTGTIINYNAEDARRLDMVVSISYNDNIEKTKSVLNKLILSDARILKSPAPLIGVSELAKSSVNLSVFVWVAPPEYQNVNFDFLESVKKEFDSAGITIPFPQMEINLKKEN